ncbi:MULE domain-containing protein, partial [Trichostrongylus colubriformis]
MGLRKPRQLWQEIAQSIDNVAVHNEALREDMAYSFYRKGYKSRRSTFKRAVAGLREHRVTMEHVPQEFAFLPDGSRFLQYQSSTLHIYFSERILEKACQVGLYALVADGAHDLQPQNTNKLGQLYTIHGVMANSVDVPLLFAITMRLLGILLREKYPCMSDLILTLQGCVTTQE